VEHRLQYLGEQIIAFAQQGIRVVQGSGVQVTVRASEKETFPHKHDAARAALEGLLKRSGKWEEISELDLAALARALEEGNWPAGLVALVRQFATHAVATALSLRASGGAAHNNEE